VFVSCYPTEKAYLHLVVCTRLRGDTLSGVGGKGSLIPDILKDPVKKKLRVHSK
jgi:hypothetical protein